MKTIKAKNLTAQLNFKAGGNPPSTQPISAISNCFPGLELDFRAIWKHLFQGIELHEAGLWNEGHVVLHADENEAAYAAGVRDADLLVAVNGQAVVSKGTREGYALEFSNALADVFELAGQRVPLSFKSVDTGQDIVVDLLVNPLFKDGSLSPTLADPGTLTQGLCSPWQADYRECGCYYWAASRPDFVNAQPEGPDGTTGKSWMQRDDAQRNRPDSRPYPNTDIPDPVHYTYQELYLKWEEKLKFVIGGQEQNTP